MQTGTRVRGARAGVAVAWLAGLLAVPVLALSAVYSALGDSSSDCRGFCLTPAEAFSVAAFFLGAIALCAFVVGAVAILALRTRARTTSVLLGWGGAAGLVGCLPALALFGRGLGVL